MPARKAVAIMATDTNSEHAKKVSIEADGKVAHPASDVKWNMLDKNT